MTIFSQCIDPMLLQDIFWTPFSNSKIVSFFNNKKTYQPMSETLVTQVYQPRTISALSVSLPIKLTVLFVLVFHR